MRFSPSALAALAILGLATTAATDEPDGSWWSLRPLTQPIPPVNPLIPAHGNAIDTFVSAGLSEAGLTASPQASRRVLARRLAIDLLGLLPDPDTVDRFVADPRPDATSHLIDRLLSHPHFGEHWARHWLDVVRYGESQGFERDKLRLDAWRYRDWVAEALNTDMPYDRFAAWQLAGDVLQPDDPSATVATGFLVAGPWDEVGNSQQSLAMKRIVRQDELEDIVSVVGQSFLGLTIHCARCHDHKFDPITQKEYYRMASALSGVRHGLRNLSGPAQAHRTSHPASSLDSRRKQLESQLEHLEATVRQRILDQRDDSGHATDAPKPFARWDFTNAARDSIGQLHGSLKGDARVEDGQLVLPAQGFLTTPPIPRPITTRTLEVWVRLDDTQQQGGGVVSLQAVDGPVHDAIAFGELEPGHWNLASENRNRTVSFHGPPEQADNQSIVHLAFVFAADGSVHAYRNGQAYGRAIQTRGPVPFAAGQARLLIGLRHTPAAKQRHLRGRIDRVQLHLAALSQQQVLASAGPLAQAIPEKALQRALTPDEQQRRDALKFEIAQLEIHSKRWRTWKTYAVSPRPPGVTRLLVRGDPADPGEAVTPGAVAAVSGLSPDFSIPADSPDPPRRRALARWITHPKNPLFARVIVNRIWHHHFGAGLVLTPSDFGLGGSLPSHPQLLDWLANQLVHHNWSLKHIHRLILNSATYQQASRFRPIPAAADATNQWLWRHPPRRLEAESLRDSLLAVSGSLNRELGGPGYYDFSTFTNNSQFYDVGDPQGVTFDRRSLYRTLARSGRNRFLDAFDCPDPSTKTPQRAVTTTPLQALSLLNSSFALRMSDQLAARVQREAEPNAAARIRHMFRLCFSRTPTRQEALTAGNFSSRHGLAALARVLFNANEFLYVD
jgi:hypothetical protein